ncbi:Pup--protein ligase [Actinomyces minihominis]|uniref:Pup--protein ligase n=1 Tax=Actinomyces minihominis TaxID=2002838 RepID=UPI000C0734CF|nr:Pup--protein ligase [Actinomyces minihominis]
MHRRIFGVETEYGLTCASTTGGVPPLEPEEAARILFEPLVKRGRSTNVFLPNGGRLYLDVGAHPEYATAECSDVWDLLAQVRAGSDMLSQMAREADQDLDERGIKGQIHLFANNMDSVGNSFGCHENYLLRRSRDFREMADALISFFVTRQIIAGAGAIVTSDDGEVSYAFSARADQMHDALSGATTRARPIINTRDEPLADSTSYRRLHVIVGDTNVAEPTTALKVASTDLVLHALETGSNFADLVLAEPLEAIRQISLDLTGEAKVALADGRLMTAVEIQREIRTRALASLRGESVSDLYAYLFDLWGRALDAVESRDWAGISTEIDYAIKMNLVHSYRERTGATLDDPRVARLLLAYHDITDAGLAPRMEASGAMLRLTSSAQVEQAVEQAPATTRATLRGAAVKAAETHRRDLGVDWVNLRLDGTGMMIALQDPFATEDERVGELISKMARD